MILSSIISPYSFPGIRIEDLPRHDVGQVHRDSRSVVAHSIVVDAIEKVTNLKLADFKSRTSNRALSEARMIYCYQVRVLLEWSLKEIGIAMGGRDHTTVIHAIKMYHNSMETDDIFYENSTEIESIIQSKMKALGIN